MKNKVGMIIAFILGAIIFSGIGAYAAIKFQANEIGYNTTSVADALDSMYQTMFSNNYSTEEKVVGKWIDGKPLYQRTFEIYKNGELNGWTSTSNVFTYNDGLDFIETLVSNVCMTSDGIITSYSPGTQSINYNTGIKRSGTDSFLIINNQYGEFKGNIAILTLQYTKTTDQPIGN